MSSDKRDRFAPCRVPDTGSAFSCDTVLSVPYRLDETVPLLTADTGRQLS